MNKLYYFYKDIKKDYGILFASFLIFISLFILFFIALISYEIYKDINKLEHEKTSVGIEEVLDYSTKTLIVPITIFNGKATTTTIQYQKQNIYTLKFNNGDIIEFSGGKNCKNKESIIIYNNKTFSCNDNL